MQIKNHSINYFLRKDIKNYKECKKYPSNL